MNIYDQVEKMLESEEVRPKWAEEILKELHEIKDLLHQNTPSKKPYHDRAYYKFVNAFREQMRADITQDIYPEINYFGQILGVNFKGFIYDKESTKTLPAHKAFQVYRYLYENQDNIERYIKR